MTIQEIVKARGITEVLHFTTHKGLTGILDSRFVKSRPRLSSSQRLEFILNLNTQRVLDRDWEDFVNLSISRINNILYGISSRVWHPDVDWYILCFDPEILSHPGVWFSTTNNAYHQHTIRGQGATGLVKLFAPSVAAVYGRPVIRQADQLACCPTCPQAEVLYPEELSTSYLRKIYVKTPEEHDSVHGQMNVFEMRGVQVIVDSSKFV